MKRLILMSLFLLLLILSTISQVKAAFGVSPADLTYEYLSPGMKVEEGFLLSKSNPDQEAEITVESDIGEASDWIKIEPGNSFTIPGGSKTETMKVEISVPDNAEYKTYSGYLNLKVAEGGKSAGVSIIGGVGIAVNLTVTKEEVAKLIIRRLEVPDITHNQPLLIRITAENKGNKEAKLDKAEVTVKDSSGKELTKGINNNLDTVNPGGKKEIIASFENQLNPGQYSAWVTIYSKEGMIKEDEIVFSVHKSDDEIMREFRIIKEMSDDWVFLLKLVLLSVIPITIIWIIIRKKYVQDN